MSEVPEGILVAVGGDDPSLWMPVFAEAFPAENAVWYDRDVPDAVLRKTGWLIAWAPDDDLFAKVPNVRAVFSLGAGVDHIFRGHSKPPKVPVIRYVGADLTNRMSEWVVMQCLMHLRQHQRYARQQAKAVWKPLDQPGADAIRVGIMGLGVLGRDAARKLSVMGFKVSGWSRTAKSVEGVTSYSGAEQLDAFLGATDILVSLLPHTAETEGLVDHRFLSRLARDGALGGPVYINAGRGKTQVDADVARALSDGTLIGASLDVFQTEPLPAGDPMWKLPNVFVTPHSAAWSARSDVVRYVMRQIERHRNGLPFENVVDPELGY